jgi:hypothetical protein
MEEYVVTVKKGIDLDQFYDEMETPGGSDTIPDREVDCYNRRPISRNTGYILSSEEVDNLKNDPRILDVVPQEILNTIRIKPVWTQTSNDWDKDNYLPESTQRNWGLYRCTRGTQVSNWGYGATVDTSGTAMTTSSGKNVDVVIVDGHLNINHPEFALNEDGTGGSRVIQYNWYQHTSELGLGSNGTYVYPTGSSLFTQDENHGMHVAGTAVGNSQGWARDANIYNISPYASNPNTTAANYIFDYIRAWHNKKAINPLTGRKNPTILNNSWGSSYAIPRSGMTVNYRGTNYSSPVDASLRSYGIMDFDATYVYPLAYVTSLIVDIEDAVDSGIIFVGAAGNEYTKIDVNGGTDYNNYVNYGGFNYYYHRGSWNSSAARSGVGGQKLSVCVGAVSAYTNERKADFSNCGPRIDVYAPGEYIISALHSSGGSAVLTNDYRNSTYKIGKYSGTSMASPQVCGVLACALEQYPNMNQKDIHEYLNQHSTRNQMYDTDGGYTDTNDLQDPSNVFGKYLYYKKERLSDGLSGPINSYGTRKSSENGVKYPRINMRITKRTS